MSELIANNPGSFLRDLFACGLDAADPYKAMPTALPPRPSGPVTVVGAGKASGAMAAALEQVWGPDLTGLVIVRDGYTARTRFIDVVEASHPIPDERGKVATRRLMDMVVNTPDDHQLIGLWSGGASSLLVQPAAHLSLLNKQRATEALLRSGVPIQDINTVRKHLSQVKGGRLATLAGSTPMLNLIISDVVGDDPAVIASGPTVADPTTCGDAVQIIGSAGIEIPDAVMQDLNSGLLETPKSIGDNVHNRIIASPKRTLECAAAFAKRHNCDVICLGDTIEGEARIAAQEMAKTAIHIASEISNPTVLLSGGEVTVTLDNGGAGGPNLEFCLALALALKAHPQVWGLACDTDGTDGRSASAGAVVSPDTLVRASGCGRDPHADLSQHNSETFFAGIGDLVTPGPTSTNVNDFRAILVRPGDS